MTRKYFFVFGRGGGVFCILLGMKYNFEVWKRLFWNSGKKIPTVPKQAVFPQSMFKISLALFQESVIKLFLNFSFLFIHYLYEKATESNFWKELPPPPPPLIYAQKRLCSVDRANVQKKPSTVLKWIAFSQIQAQNFIRFVLGICSRGFSEVLQGSRSVEYQKEVKPIVANIFLIAPKCDIVTTIFTPKQIVSFALKIRSNSFLFLQRWDEN